jgi:hypothetical protein
MTGESKPRRILGLLSPNHQNRHSAAGGHAKQAGDFLSSDFIAVQKLPARK